MKVYIRSIFSIPAPRRISQRQFERSVPLTPAFTLTRSRSAAKLKPQDPAGPDPDEPYNYVNFHAFAANLEERRIHPTDPTWAIWAQREALEGWERHEPEQAIPDDVYILAAAQWILWYGQTFFKQVLFPGEITPDVLSMWKPARCIVASQI